MNPKSKGRTSLIRASAAIFLIVQPALIAFSQTQEARPKVCVASPDVQFGQGVGGVSDPTDSVRATLIAYLSGPMADVVALDSMIEMQINAEAELKACDFVLQSAITHKKAKKKLGGLLSAAPAIIGVIPGMAQPDDYAAVAAAAAAAQGIASMEAERTQEDMMREMTGLAARSIKKGDSILMTFRLHQHRIGKPITENKLSAKAEEDGENILSPLIADSANQVLTEVKKNPISSVAVPPQPSTSLTNDGMSSIEVREPESSADQNPPPKVSRQVPHRHKRASDSPLSAAWQKGNLHIPKFERLSDPDAMAIELAASVRSQGDESLVSLVRALMASGVAIQKESGELIAPPPGRLPPILLAEWQVAAIGKQYAVGAYIPLSAIGELLHKHFPDANVTELNRAILSDIQAATGSNDPTHRFWGRFILALGVDEDSRLSESALSGHTRETITLDPIQAALVTGRLLQDLLVLKAAPASTQQEELRETNRQLFAREGVTDYGMQSRSGVVKNVGQAKSVSWLNMVLDWIISPAYAGPPCQYGDIETKILSGYATTTDAGFEILMGVIGKTSAASTIGAITSFLEMLNSGALMAALAIDLSIDHEPLVRTKSSEDDGERGFARASIKFDTDSYQWVNCIAPALNLLGLGLGAESSNKSGARINWKVVDGADLFGFNFTLQQEALSTLNSEGKNEVVLMGRRQDCRMPDGAPPIEKTGTIRAGVSPRELKDMTDILLKLAQWGVAFGFGGFGALPAINMDALAYTDWINNQTLSFDITDWSVDGDVIVKEERRMNFCTSGACVDADSAGETKITLVKNADDCSVSGNGQMIVKDLTSANFSKSAVGGYSEGRSLDVVNVGIEGKLDRATKKMMFKLKMASGGRSGQINATVNVLGKPYSESVSDDGESYDSSDCTHEMCTGFELPLSNGDLKEWTFQIPGGQQKYSVAYLPRKQQ